MLVWALTVTVAGALRAEQAILECTADTWVQEKETPQGRTQELLVRGKGQVALLNFRFSAIPDWRVQQAALLVHLDTLEPPKKIGVAVLPVAWVEAEATYEQAAAGKPWPGKGLRALLTGATATVREKELGWVEIDIPPALAQSLVEKRGFGFALYLGTLRAPQRLHSRETASQAPYLVVQGTRR